MDRATGPRVELFHPRAIVAGERFELRAVVHVDRAIAARAISIAVEGTTASLTDGGPPSAFLTFGAPVWVGNQLEPGRHAFAAQCELPGDAPSSYVGASVMFEYTAEVRFEGPPGATGGTRFPLRVLAAPAARFDRPTVYVSDLGGPGSGAPYLELSTATTELRPGVRLPLALAIAADREPFTSIQVRLVAIERRTGWFETAVERPIIQLAVPLDQLSGDAVGVALPVPDEVVPGFDTGWFRLSWEVQARAIAGSGAQVVVSMPVTVRPGEAPLAQLSPPPVGDERRQRLWREVGAAQGFELGDDGDLVRSYAGGMSARIGSHTDVRRGARLRGEVAFPALGIGLEVDSRGRVDARDPEHQRIVREHLGDPLAASSVSHVDDTVIRLERPGSAGRETLAALVRDLGWLAAQVDAVRAALPPPAALAGEIAGWERAAARLGGVLERAGPTIRGGRDRATWSIAVGWDAWDRPMWHQLCVSPGQPIDTRHHRVWVVGQMPPEQPEWARLADGATELAVSRDELTLTLPRAGHDIDAAADRLSALLAIAEALRRGPGQPIYR